MNPHIAHKKTGTVYLIGAGPGAADLITLRGAKLLAQADIVLHDALVHPDTLALAPQALKVAVGKRRGAHSTAQAFICKRLVDAAQKYAIVVRLKGGDPMLFGRAEEEISALKKAGIAFEIVPGITAALGAAASLQIPLTQRGIARSVLIATPARAADETLNVTLPNVKSADTLALYMGKSQAKLLQIQLLAQGKPVHTPVLFVANATWENQSHSACRLDELEHTAQALPEGAAVLILVGEVFAEQLHAQQTILATKPHLAIAKIA
jgi:uroporphyrin-III C-methyltransferase